MVELYGYKTGEVTVSEMFRNYHLRSYSLEALEGYFRYLSFTAVGSRTLPYHFLLIDNEDKKYGRDFIKDFAEGISKSFHEKRKIWEVSEEELLKEQESVLNSLRDNDILVIRTDIEGPMTEKEERKWTALSEAFDQYPSIVKFLVVSREISEYRFRPVEQIYYRTFRNHIDTRLLQSSDDLLYWLKEELTERKYEFTGEFETEIKDYIDTVYPKAQLKEERFLDDLIYRIETEYYRKAVKNDRILTGVHVPFYKKADGTLNVEEERQYALQYSGPAFDPKPLSAEETKERNVLVLSMSTLPFLKEGQKPDAVKYWARIPEAENRYAFFCGVSQLEAGTKYWITRLAAAGKSLDKIIVYATKEALKKEKMYGSKSAVDVYTEDILEFVSGEKSEKTVLSAMAEDEPHVSFLTRKEKDYAEDGKNIGTRIEEINIVNTASLVSGSWREKDGTWIVPVDETLQEGAQMPEIQQLNKLYAEISSVVPSELSGIKLNLYLDAQGGQRTFFNLIFSLFSLQNQAVMDIKGVSAILFERDKPIHQIQDVTEEFQTIGLVGAVKAFSQYGRGDLLTEYQRGSKRYFNDQVSIKLIPAIQKVADAISISDPTGFDEGIEELKNILKDKQADRLNPKISEDKTSPYYFIANEIWDKYRALLSDDKNALTTVRWCIENQFYQQALSFIEDKMPVYILSRLLHISYKEITSGISDSWHRIDQIGEGDPDYEAECFAVEKITGESRFYVSVEGSFLYQCFSSMKSAMDKMYADMVCVEILKNESSRYQNKIREIGKLLLNVSNNKRKEFAGVLFRDYLNMLSTRSGKKMKVKDFVRFAVQDGKGRAPYFQRHGNDTRWIDSAYLSTYNKAGTASDVNDFLGILCCLQSGDVGELKMNATFEGVCSGLAGFLTSSDSGSYLSNAVDEILSMLVQILRKEQDKNKTLVEEIRNVLGTSANVSSFSELQIFCYGNHAAEMQIAYSRNDSAVQKELEDFKKRITVDRDPESYICYHDIVDKLEKNSGSYCSGYGDYAAAERLKDQYPGIVHQARHWHTVLGAASWVNEGQNQSLPVMEVGRAGCESVIRNGDLIEIEYGPFSRGGKAWKILCEVPAKKKENLERLDLFLGLHAAMKQERNVCNHASDSRLRLSVEFIRGMLDKYIELESELEKLT